MSFYTPIPSPIILESSFAANTPRLVAEEISENDLSWDTMVRSYVLRTHATATHDQVLALFPGVGEVDLHPDTLDPTNMYLAARKVARRMGGLWSAELSYLGTVGDRPGYRVEVGSATTTSTPPNGAVVGGSYRPRANILEQSVVVNVSYIHVGGMPDTAIVGTAVTPPGGTTPGGLVVPAVKAALWEGFGDADAAYHFPNGWVLVNRTPTNPIRNVYTIWSVTDTYQYFYAKIP